MLTLSQVQRDRLVVIRQWQDGLITGIEGAARLGMSARHFRRLCRRFEEEGDAAVVPMERHRRGNPRYPEADRQSILEQATTPLYQDFGPTLLAEHAAVQVPSWTVRRWLIKAAVWKPREARLKHRRRRVRRPRYGELVMMDSSIHDWLEGRTSEKLVLIAMIDDATNDLYARFYPADTGVANQMVLMEWLRSRGRMQSLYTDRASHFSRSADGARTQSAIRRGLNALGAELILALSPQAKGRVERLFGTLQDRLVKEMRVAGVSSLAAANQFLDEQFLAFWRRRFRVEPADFADAHLSLPEGTDLQQTFAEAETRVIAKDFTVRHNNRFWQIEAAEAEEAMVLQRIRVETWPDGSLHFFWRGRYLAPTLVAQQEARPQGVRWKPPRSHPLRKNSYRTAEPGVASLT